MNPGVESCVILMFEIKFISVLVHGGIFFIVTPQTSLWWDDAPLGNKLWFLVHRAKTFVFDNKNEICDESCRCYSAYLFFQLVLLILWTNENSYLTWIRRPGFLEKLDVFRKKYVSLFLRKVSKFKHLRNVLLHLGLSIFHITWVQTSVKTIICFHMWYISVYNLQKQSFCKIHRLSAQIHLNMGWYRLFGFLKKLNYFFSVCVLS